jgi:hypothetical protein
VLAKVHALLVAMLRGFNAAYNGRIRAFTSRIDDAHSSSIVSIDKPFKSIHSQSSGRWAARDKSATVRVSATIMSRHLGLLVAISPVWSTWLRY